MSRARALKTNNAKPYHYGDLRAAAVAEGLRQIVHASNPSDLSLRHVAREIGVSPTALYRHFPDKDALLGAMASRGFDVLQEAQRSAYGRGGKRGLTRAARAYVRFAIANPALFRMIFSAPLEQTHPFETPPEESAAAVLAEGVAAALGPRARRATIHAATIKAWTLVHGMAMLILHGQLRLADIDALIDKVISDDTLLPG